MLACNFYAPYISGVTEYVRRLAESLVQAGHEVVVVASRHDPALARHETLAGVQVERVPVLARISKGVIAPAYPARVAAHAAWADVVNLHLPMLESGFIAPFVPGRKLVVTYHCDIDLPPGLGKKLIEPPLFASMDVAMRRARCLVANTLDYSRQSPTLSKYIDKVREIAPPIVPLPAPTRKRSDARPTVGFLGRFVEEKGLDVLLSAFGRVLARMPDARLILAGDHQSVAGGSIIERLRPQIAELGAAVELPGKLPFSELPNFFADLDVFALPSVNSFESFGMVQVEAMFEGVPVVASSLPGVRTIIQNTGMGLLVPPRDAGALADALIRVLEAPDAFRKPAETVMAHYGLDLTLQRYLDVFAGETAPVAAPGYST